MRWLVLLLLCCASAQAQVFSTDFESGLSAFTLNIPGLTNSIQSNRVHSGTKALFYNPSAGTTAGGLAVPIPASTTVYAKFWWWVPNTITGGAGHHGFRITKRIGDQFTPHWELDTTFGGGSDFAIDILFHDDGIDSGLAYHHIVVLPLNQWFEFAILTVLNTPGASDGVLKVWINGVQKLTFTDVLYRKVGTSMNGYDTFLLTTNFDGAGAESYWYMDDVSVFNTFVLLAPVLRVN